MDGLVGKSPLRRDLRGPTSLRLAMRHGGRLFSRRCLDQMIQTCPRHGGSPPVGMVHKISLDDHPISPMDNCLLYIGAYYHRLSYLLRKCMKMQVGWIHTSKSKILYASALSTATVLKSLSPNMDAHHMRILMKPHGVQ